MKTTQGVALALVMAATLAGCTDDGGDPQVRFETSLGNFTVELWPDKAPVTVENFLRYVNDGHYDGLTFHRIAPGFVVQGGGYLPDHETLRPTRESIVNEASSEVPNEKATLSMARLQAPDSATSQFFINLKANTNLDPNAQSAGYAVFGKVVSGFDTVEAMTEVEPGEPFGAGGFWPAEPIVILKATQTQGEKPEPPAPPTPAQIDGDLITPGTWHVTNTQDAILAWADNTGGTAANVAFSVTGADGGDLPDGWSLSFDARRQAIGADGSSTQTIHSMARLTVPEGTSGDFDLELHTGNSTTPFVATVDLIHDRISLEGDEVKAKYAGTCTKDGKPFDAGEFPLTLGGGRAIVGFDLGLVGLGLNEQATLVIPAALAYGDSGGRTGCLNPADLNFDVEIIEFVA